jgi:surface polysaccharide O-acyltransferase-like enzyme
MTFFNFQEDNTGNQQFQVSEKWWYFLAATIPLTIIVFLVWIAWQKWRFRTLAEEDRKSLDPLG